MDHDYGQISKSTLKNTLIYRCFQFIDKQEQRKFVKKFRDQAHDNTQVMNTLSELVLGAFLRSIGYRIEYERTVEIFRRKYSPDWMIRDEECKVIGFVEMVNYYIDKKTETEIGLKRKGNSVISYWIDANDPEHSRLFSSIQKKASKYKQIVEEFRIPFVTAVYIDSRTVVDYFDLNEVLHTGSYPIFNFYPSLSGVLKLEEQSPGLYSCNYFENPNSLYPIHIPSGDFQIDLEQCE